MPLARAAAFPVPRCACWLVGPECGWAGGASAFVAIASLALWGVPWVRGMSRAAEGRGSGSYADHARVGWSK